MWGSKKKKNPGYSYFSSSVTLEGKLYFSGIIRLDGRVNGEIVSTGTLVVEETAVITGDILVENIVLSGTVYGNIEASKQVQLNATAKVFGHINYGELSIEGAVHEGSSHKLTADEVAAVQKECVELLEQASARAEQYVPDFNNPDKYTLISKSAGQAAKPAALPNSQPKLPGKTANNAEQLEASKTGHAPGTTGTDLAKDIEALTFAKPSTTD